MNTPPSSVSSNLLGRQLTSSSLSSALFSAQKGHESNELTLEEALARLEIEGRLKEGAENLLQVLDTRTRERAREGREVRRLQVVEELNQTNTRINALKARIDELQAGTPSKSQRQIRADDSLAIRTRAASTPRITLTEGQDAPLWSITDLLSSMLRPGEEDTYYIEQGNRFVRLLDRHNSLQGDLPMSAITNCVCRFTTSTNANLVASGYRIARRVSADENTAEAFLVAGLERCLVTSLAKEHKLNIEREQAIKFIRHIYSISSQSHSLISSSILRALVSLAEHEDVLAQICLETLAELTVLGHSLIVSCGVIRCLINSLVDGAPRIGDELVMVLIQALDTPASRKVLHPNDLSTVIHPFTEFSDGKNDSATDDRILASTAVVARLLNSWPGILAISMHDFRAVKSIVDALRVPRSAVRTAVLDFLIDVLSVSVNNMTTTFLAGRRLTTLGRIPMSVESAKAAQDSNSQKTYSLLDQFSALKLVLFLEVGVLDALMVVIEDKTDTDAVRKATLLIGEVLQLANTLLPLARCRTLQSLPRLFKGAASLKDTSRAGATSALYQIESLNRTRYKASITRALTSTGDKKRGQRQVEQVKIKMGLQIDDSHFRNLLLDTQVLSTKNYTKWHWDTLTELVQGPLLNAKRLEESMRATKFMKRLLAFYRPFTHRFSAIKNTKPNQKYIKFGCLLLNTLLANSDGVRYLTESKLLRQLSECLAQMDPMNHVTASDALFSRVHIDETLCHGYFDFIGTLSAHPLGIAMLERWRMFSNLYHLTELRSRTDLVTLFLRHLDYSTEGHARIILGKALTTGLKEVRLFATHHLGSLIAKSGRKIAEWAIRLLIIQLYDVNTDVCEAAVAVLEVACDSPEYLEHIVDQRPALDHLGELGGPLLLKFLATSVGFHYLQELNYIDREMDDWLHGRSDEYVIQVEAMLLQALAPDTDPMLMVERSQTPLHFYGELTKTSEGVEHLLKSGHFDLYADLLQQHWHESEEPTLVRRVKAALWAIGNIGATERGANFLKGCQVIEYIVKTAECSEVATLKGTAYFVLGMLSATKLGVELLEEYHWCGVVTSMGEPIGICLPDDIRKVLSTQPWVGPSTVDQPSLAKTDPLSTEILTAMSNLSNHILANDAAQALIRLKRKYPAKFGSLTLYDQAHLLLSRYSYRLTVRKFILDLFSNDVLSSYITRRQPAPEPLSLPPASESLPASSTLLRPFRRSHRAATISS